MNEESAVNEESPADDLSLLIDLAVVSRLRAANFTDAQITKIADCRRAAIKDAMFEWTARP
jgi:hypothetical protein